MVVVVLRVVGFCRTGILAKRTRGVLGKRTVLGMVLCARTLGMFRGKRMVLNSRSVPETKRSVPKTKRSVFKLERSVSKLKRSVSAKRRVLALSRIHI